jgi:hypothetical protein
MTRFNRLSNSLHMFSLLIFDGEFEAKYVSVLLKSHKNPMKNVTNNTEFAHYSYL